MALKIAILQIQEKICVENAYVSQLKEFSRKWKSFLKAGVKKQVLLFFLLSTQDAID